MIVNNWEGCEKKRVVARFKVLCQNAVGCIAENHA